MQFRNINKLKEQIKEKSVSQRQQLQYTIMLVLLISLSFIVYLQTSSTNLDLLLILIELLLGVMGIYYAFECNRGDDGDQFILKVITLNRVWGIRRMIIYVIPVSIFFYGLLFPAAGIPVPQHTTHFDVFIVSFLTVFYYVRLGNHMKDVA